jgi:putative SOS response-associated peptidase YedK
MPVLLDRPGQSAWLDPAQRDPQALAPLLRPCPDDWLALHAVAPDVGDARREGAMLIEPLPGLSQAAPE